MLTVSILQAIGNQSLSSAGNSLVVDLANRYDNPALDTLVEQADAGTMEEFVAGMKAAAKLLAEDAAAIWLYCLPNLVVTRAGITGIPTNATSLSFDATTMASA